MKRLVCAVALVSLSLAGCSGSLCDEFDDSGKELVDKVKNCPSFSEVTYEEPTEAERQQCENSLEACTDSDKEALNKFIDCIGDLPECTASTEQTFATSFLACAAPLQSVSDACGAVTSDGMVRKGLAMVKGR
ncbi:MAG TPA: hypothetical protein VNA24_16855 [Hyalangium sp.]|jgi:hypothetical protein|nr:hypothetical protein [Hyalangium sp.]